MDTSLSLLTPSELCKTTSLMHEQATNAKKLIFDELEIAVVDSEKKRKSNLFSIRKKLLHMLNAY
jgi:hypothetical protein